MFFCQLKLASRERSTFLCILSLIISYSSANQSNLEVLYETTSTDSTSSFSIFPAKFPLTWRDAAELCESIPGSVLAKITGGETERTMLQLMKVSRFENSLWIRNRQTISEVLAKERSNIPSIPNEMATIEDSYPAESEAGMTLQCSLIRPKTGIANELCNNNYSALGAICVQSYNAPRPFKDVCPSLPGRPWMLLRNYRKSSSNVTQPTLSSLLICSQTNMVLEVNCDPQKGWNTTIRCPKTSHKLHLMTVNRSNWKINEIINNKRRNIANNFQMLPYARFKRSAKSTDQMDVIEMLMKNFKNKKTPELKSAKNESTKESAKNTTVNQTAVSNTIRVLNEHLPLHPAYINTSDEKSNEDSAGFGLIKVDPFILDNNNEEKKEEATVKIETSTQDKISKLADQIVDFINYNREEPYDNKVTDTPAHSLDSGQTKEENLNVSFTKSFQKTTNINSVTAVYDAETFPVKADVKVLISKEIKMAKQSALQDDIQVNQSDVLNDKIEDITNNNMAEGIPIHFNKEIKEPIDEELNNESSHIGNNHSKSQIKDDKSQVLNNSFDINEQNQSINFDEENISNLTIDDSKSPLSDKIEMEPIATDEPTNSDAKTKAADETEGLPMVTDTPIMNESIETKSSRAISFVEEESTTTNTENPIMTISGQNLQEEEKLSSVSTETSFSSQLTPEPIIEMKNPDKKNTDLAEDEVQVISHEVKNRNHFVYFILREIFG